MAQSNLLIATAFTTIFATTITNTNSGSKTSIEILITNLTADPISTSSSTTSIAINTTSTSPSSSTSTSNPFSNEISTSAATPSSNTINQYKNGDFILNWSLSADSIDFEFLAKTKLTSNFWAAFAFSKDTDMVCYFLL